jgi:hypothetical protein
MGFSPVPNGPGLTPLFERLADLELQLRILQRPSGVDLAGLLQQVQQVLVNITSQVNTLAAAYLAANTYTRANVDNLVAHPPAGSAVTGNVTATGTASFGGVVTADAGVSSVDAKTRVLASGWSSLWVDTSGRFGQSPSARRYKQNIEPANLDVAGLLALEPVSYRLKAAVAEFGDDARVEVGLIAEDVQPVAEWAIAYSADGEVQGINYDRLTVALFAIVKEQAGQITAISKRLASIGG